MAAATEHPEPCLAVVFMPTAQGLFIPVLKRSKNGETWFDLPGGKISIGENVFAGIEREVLEETNMVVQAGVYLGNMPHPVRPGLKRHFFSAVYVEGAPQNRLPAEHDDLVLLSPLAAFAALGKRITRDVQDYMVAVDRAAMPRLRIRPSTIARVF